MKSFTIKLVFIALLIPTIFIGVIEAQPKQRVIVKPTPKVEVEKEVKVSSIKKEEPKTIYEMSEEELQTHGEAIIEDMPENLKQGLTIFTKSNNTKTVNGGEVLAYMKNKTEVYWVAPEGVTKPILYHEMGHVFDLRVGIYKTPEMIEAFEEEWVGKDHYGSKNIHEAIAVMISFVYCGGEVVNAPKTESIVRQFLGKDEWEEDMIKYQPLLDGSKTIEEIIGG